MIIKDVRLCAASNGLIVSYDMWGKKEDNPYSDEAYLGEKKEVFKLNEKTKAMDCFIEYATKAGVITSDESDEE
jgi:hypothetical protein